MVTKPDKICRSFCNHPPPPPPPPPSDWLLRSPPCKSLLYAELFAAFFFARDLGLGGVFASAGEERPCTVGRRKRNAHRAFFPPHMTIFMHMDSSKEESRGWGVRPLAAFTGCGGAAAVFAERRLLALEAAMSGARARQLASL